MTQRSSLAGCLQVVYRGKTSYARNEKSRWRKTHSAAEPMSVATDESCIQQVAAAADSSRPGSSCVDVDRSGADTISSIDANLHQPHRRGVCRLSFRSTEYRFVFSPFSIALFTVRLAHSTQRRNTFAGYGAAVKQQRH